MRRLWAAAAVLLLAGCGTSAGSAAGRATDPSGPQTPSPSAPPSTPPSGRTSSTPAAPAAPSTSTSFSGPASSTPSSAGPTRTTGVPGPRDWQEMSDAVHDSQLTAQVPDTDYVVVGLQLAGAHGRWAGGMIEPREPQRLQPAAVLLHRVDGRWTLVDLGTGLVGCGVAPTSVLEQLRFFGVPPQC